MVIKSRASSALHLVTIYSNMVNMTTPQVVALAERARRFAWQPTPGMCREIRTKAGVTQAELATALGVSRKTLIHWERGERTPRSETRERYYGALRLLQGGGPDAA